MTKKIGDWSLTTSMCQISELKSSFLAKLYELYFEVLLFRDSTENIYVHFRSSQSICTASQRKFTVCRPDHSNSVQMVNAESVISPICAASSLREGRVVWPPLKPASYLPLSLLLFLPPPSIRPFPFCSRASRGFLCSHCIAAQLFHPSRLLASIRLLALSFAAYSYPWLPPTTPHSPTRLTHPPSTVTPAIVSPALTLSWAAVWEWGHCWPVAVCMCVHVRDSRRVSASLSGRPTSISALSFSHSV